MHNYDMNREIVASFQIDLSGIDVFAFYFSLETPHLLFVPVFILSPIAI